MFAEVIFQLGYHFDNDVFLSSDLAFAAPCLVFLGGGDGDGAVLEVNPISAGSSNFPSPHPAFAGEEKDEL